tara:strand:+ start:3019 stop:3312 length:294 start_codon:yes stop_codon:yes gene_type:complete
MTEHSQNDIKICENAGLKLYQELALKTITNNYNELIELIELFKVGATVIRQKELKVYKQNIDKKYLPHIREAKRVLKNTYKRLDYNMNRSDKLKGFI